MITAEVKSSFKTPTHKHLSPILMIGFLYGALTYGAVLSIQHLIFNHVISVKDSLVLFGYFLLVYGLWVLVTFFLIWIIIRSVNEFLYLFKRRYDKASSMSKFSLKKSLFWGFTCFNFIYWFLFFNYGLTYDHYPFGELKNIYGMIIFLSVRSIILLFVILITSKALSALLINLYARKKLIKISTILFLMMASIHIAISIYIKTSSPS